MANTFTLAALQRVIEGTGEPTGARGRGELSAVHLLEFAVMRERCWWIPKAGRFSRRDADSAIPSHLKD